MSTVFGKEEESLLNSFMNQIEVILAKNKIENGKTLVNASDLLYITLNDYHNNRINHNVVTNQSGGNFEVNNNNNNNNNVNVLIYNNDENSHVHLKNVNNNAVGNNNTNTNTNKNDLKKTTNNDIKSSKPTHAKSDNKLTMTPTFSPKLKEPNFNNNNSKLNNTDHPDNFKLRANVMNNITSSVDKENQESLKEKTIKLKQQLSLFLKEKEIDL